MRPLLKIDMRFAAGAPARGRKFLQKFPFHNIACPATGGGKSLYYRLPTLHFEGLTLTILALNSLLKDRWTLSGPTTCPPSFQQHTVTLRDRARAAAGARWSLWAARGNKQIKPLRDACILPGQSRR